VRILLSHVFISPMEYRSSLEPKGSLPCPQNPLLYLFLNKLVNYLTPCVLHINFNIIISSTHKFIQIFHTKLLYAVSVLFSLTKWPWEYFSWVLIYLFQCAMFFILFLLSFIFIYSLRLFLVKHPQSITFSFHSGWIMWSCSNWDAWTPVSYREGPHSILVQCT
jgi:hypothetical protein